MSGNAIDENPEGHELNSIELFSHSSVPQSLSCTICGATNFPNLSKLNKHRNTHDKPYDCLAEGCHERFAQRQALDRHTETKHSDSKNPSKFYHCTVDGCKYSRSSRWGKRFLRADQVKEHIKDYGHYGPHSPNHRPRRPDMRIIAIQVILTRFEEWLADENGDSRPRRRVLCCEYDSFKTKLWHTDVTSDTFLKKDDGATKRYHCTADGCYYNESALPEGCDRIAFKTEKDLQEHYRRAHEPGFLPSLATQLGERERGNALSLTSTDSSSSITLTGNAELPSMGIMSLDLTTGFCSVAHGFDCYCQSCCQRGTTTQQQSENTISQTPIYSRNLLLEQDWHIDDDVWDSMSVPAIDFEKYLCGHLSSNTVSPSRQRSPKSIPLTRLSCDFRGCTSTFRRKYEKQRHIDTVHSVATPFTCPICEREFLRKDKLYNHLRSMHGIQPNSAKSVISNSSSYSSKSGLSGPGFPTGKDIAPGDLIKPSSGSERWWMSGIGDHFRDDHVVNANRNHLLSGVGWRSDSPGPILTPTPELQISLEESTPNPT